MACARFGAYKFIKIIVLFSSSPETITHLPSLSVIMFKTVNNIFLEMRMQTPFEAVVPGEKKICPTQRCFNFKDFFGKMCFL